MTAASDDLFRFSFVIDAPVVFGMTYKLIEWDPSITTLPYDVKKFVAEFTGQDGIKADFSYAEDGGLNVVFPQFRNHQKSPCYWGRLRWHLPFGGVQERLSLRAKLVLGLCKCQGIPLG